MEELSFLFFAVYCVMYGIGKLILISYWHEKFIKWWSRIAKSFGCLGIIVFCVSKTGIDFILDIWPLAIIPGIIFLFASLVFAHSQIVSYIDNKKNKKSNKENDNKNKSSNKSLYDNTDNTLLIAGMKRLGMKKELKQQFGIDFNEDEETKK